MKHIHDTIIREYLNGCTIQVKKSNGQWEDLITVDKLGKGEGLPSFLSNLEYRVKPSSKYLFLHTVNLLKVSDEKGYTTLFEYPTYTPSGPHVMFEVEEKKVTVAYISDSGKVNLCSMPTKSTRS